MYENILLWRPHRPESLIRQIEGEEPLMATTLGTYKWSFVLQNFVQSKNALLYERPDAPAMLFNTEHEEN